MAREERATRPRAEETAVARMGGGRDESVEPREKAWPRDERGGHKTQGTESSEADGTVDENRLRRRCERGGRGVAVEHEARGSR